MTFIDVRALYIYTFAGLLDSASVCAHVFSIFSS